MSLMSLGLVRGLVGQAVGTAAGVVLVILMRALMGLDPVWDEEPIVVMGAIFGVLGFLTGVGAMDDWFKWMNGQRDTHASRTTPRQTGVDALL